ncbi:MAG: radical SAM family heme chaperone HemW [Elusimicrobiales bacterium]|nr:radical SAM family heme chaperone HemW [Elusimicrobiales bacterium]
MKMRGLYVHIPFCRSKCGYCDFPSEAGREADIGAYLDALTAEAARYDGLAGSFSTLYVGGGTPSLLSPDQFGRLLGVLESLTGPLAGLRESTFEANPESLDEEKAVLLKKAGVGRVSLGLQATQDRLLKQLGRLAMREDFLRAYRTLRAAGFDNLSADLMCGLPGQSEAEFAESLDWLLGLAPEHVSLYALEVHEGTPFHSASVAEAPDAAAAMYEAAAARLKAAGLERYEISNFARAGRESLHNLNYWEQGEYLGLGPGAASYLDGERRANAPALNGYLEAAGAGLPPPEQYREKLQGRAKNAELVMLGLRKTAGIELPEDIFIEFRPELDRLLEAGLIETRGRQVRIREDRLYVANAVFREFV